MVLRFSAKSLFHLKVFHNIGAHELCAVQTFQVYILLLLLIAYFFLMLISVLSIFCISQTTLHQGESAYFQCFFFPYAGSNSMKYYCVYIHLLRIFDFTLYGIFLLRNSSNCSSFGISSLRISLTSGFMLVFHQATSAVHRLDAFNCCQIVEDP